MSRIRSVEGHEFEFDARNLARDGVAQSFTFKRGGTVRIAKFAAVIHTEDGGRGAFNIDLTHFGIVLLVNFVIGQITPSSGRAAVRLRLDLEDAARIAGQGGVAVRRGVDRRALLLTYVPALSLWLPAALK